MSRADIDEVLNYLSIKFNKIFCEREFVGSVLCDFERLLEEKNRCCVLVFPTLGPIYLKALRYQAKIFDLMVFNITSTTGKFKSLAICHKDHLKKTEEVMSEPFLRKKRPERQLYIPPAQRGSRLSSKAPGKSKCFSDPVIFGLSDIVNLLYFLQNNFRTLTVLDHRYCYFRKFLQFKNFDKALSYSQFIKTYDCCRCMSNPYWNISPNQKQTSTFVKSYPVFDLKVIEPVASKPSAVLIKLAAPSLNCDRVAEVFEENAFKIECDIPEADKENYSVIDLSEINMGHMCIVSVDEHLYFTESLEQHNELSCCSNAREQLKNCKQQENGKQAQENLQSELKIVSNTPKDILKNRININKKTESDIKHEQEKEIMRLTKEYINRKSKPIMKYVDDRIDTLKLDNESVNNWEDLFDAEGEIQENLFTEVLEKVGDGITIMKASEDYSAYTNKPPEDLEHIVELYNFPATLETHDLVQAFSDINSDAMYIKWVDDTHALLVLGSLSQAQKAISMNNPLIKVRPMTAASAISVDVANKSDLRPAMKRPPTNLQTARRLITSHLGTKSKVTKEQMAKEKQDLKNAREMKRLIKQSERDAWEGNIRSSVN